MRVIHENVCGTAPARCHNDRHRALDDLVARAGHGRALDPTRDRRHDHRIDPSVSLRHDALVRRVVLEPVTPAHPRTGAADAETPAFLLQISRGREEVQHVLRRRADRRERGTLRVEEQARLCFDSGRHRVEVAPARRAAIGNLQAAPARHAGGQHRLEGCPGPRGDLGLRRVAPEPELGRDGERGAVGVGLEHVVRVASHAPLLRARGVERGGEQRARPSTHAPGVRGVPMLDAYLAKPRRDRGSSRWRHGPRGSECHQLRSPVQRRILGQARARSTRWRRARGDSDHGEQSAHALAIRASHGIIASLGERVQGMNAHPVAVCQLAVGEGGVDNYPVLAVWLRSRAHLLRPPRVERHLVEYLVPASPRPPGDVGLHLRESASQ